MPKLTLDTIERLVPDSLAADGHAAIPSELRTKRFMDVRNPFEPLLSLWSEGYALDAITERSIVLAAQRVNARHAASITANKRASKRSAE